MKPSPRFISGLEQNISVLFGSDTIFNLFPRKWKQQGVGSRGREGASQRAPGRGQWTPLEAGFTRYWSSVGSEVRARDKTMVMPQGGWCIGLVTLSIEMVTVWWLVICLVRAGQWFKRVVLYVWLPHPSKISFCCTLNRANTNYTCLDFIQNTPNLKFWTGMECETETCNIATRISLLNF